MIGLFSFCFSFLWFNLAEASFVPNIKVETADIITDIKYTPDNNYLYVTTTSNDSIFVADTLSNEVINNITGVGENLMLPQIEKYEYEILIITSDGKLVKHIPIPIYNNAVDIVYNPDNKFMYVTNPEGNSIFVVNASSNEITNVITGVGGSITIKSIAYNPDNKFMYVTNFYDRSISVINTTSNEVIKNITGVGENPSSIAYNPDNKFMYIINSMNATKS